MITEFKGEFGFLSNFAWVTVKMYGVDYPSVEHAYQAAKTLDLTERERIRAARTPGEAKRLGRTVTLRPGWEDMKLAVMTELVRRKFQNPAFREMLLATGDRWLVEGNEWGDSFWGCTWNEHSHHWIGSNHLGKILTQIREELR